MLQSRLALLTLREREVFEVVAAGEPNKMIARHLGISFRTVELDRAHIVEMLQARSLSDLISMAIIVNPTSRSRSAAPDEEQGVPEPPACCPPRLER